MYHRCFLTQLISKTNLCFLVTSTSHWTPLLVVHGLLENWFQGCGHGLSKGSSAFLITWILPRCQQQILMVALLLLLQGHLPESPWSVKIVLLQTLITTCYHYTYVRVISLCVLLSNWKFHEDRNYSLFFFNDYLTPFFVFIHHYISNV